jgi:peptide/nickel transport system permease protein
MWKHRVLTLLLETAKALALIIGITVLVFMLVRVIPGDVVDLLAVEGGLTEEMKSEMRRELGLSDSWSEQLAIWVARALQGDLGLSLLFQRSIADLILHALPVTLELAFWSFLVGFLLGSGSAVGAFLRPGSIFSWLVNALNVWSIAVPTFCAGIGCILLFIIWLEWMPLLGNMVLPVIIIGVDVAGQIAKPLHEDLKETSTATFVRTAYAKGLTRARVILFHILPNSLSVVLALSGVILAGLVGGTITMEVLFGLPGIAKLALDSVLGRDYPLVQAVILFMALAVVIVNYLMDGVAILIDPRWKK